MAHTGIYATSDEILVKAGELYDTSITEARINDLCTQVEGQINSSCQKVWAADSTAFSALPSTVQGLLSELTSNLVAIYIIIYNPAGFTNLREVEDMLIVLMSRAKAIFGVITQKDFQKWADSL